MPTVKEMAESHLGNVQKAIGDLEAQKVQIDEEIAKLQTYLADGVKVLQEGSSATETVEESK